MPDQNELRRALAAHLDYYRELGVAGISRDRSWTERLHPMIYAPSADEGQEAPEAGDAMSADAAALAAPAAYASTGGTGASQAGAHGEGEDSHVSATFQAGGRGAGGATPSGAGGAGQTSASLSANVTTAPTADWQGGIETVESDASARPVAEILQEVRTDIGDCTRCKLAGLGRRQIVFGVGNPNARLMFVGEAPGRDEDEQGEPFVGRAGQLLTKIIEAIGLKREDVYIANVIKCRPPENRNPEPDEVETCEPFLFRQVDAIKPKVIVALGTFAAHALLKTSDPISRLRGRVFNYRGSQLIPTFHPAFLLRSPERKRDTWEDMKKVRSLLQSDVS